LLTPNNNKMQHFTIDMFFTGFWRPYSIICIVVWLQWRHFLWRRNVSADRLFLCR